MAFDAGSVVAHFKADLSNFKAGVAEAKAEANGFKQGLSAVGTGIGAVAHQATIFTGLAAAGFVLLSKTAIDSASNFEQNRVAFESMLGSAEKAKVLLQQLSKFAKETPFNLPQVVEGAKRLLAYGIEQEKIIPTFRMLGDVASAVGRDKLPELILAFGQVKAKGRLMGQELIQISNTGFDLAQQMGLTRGELMEMMQAGEVSFEMVEKAFQKATSKGGLFFDMMKRQSKTFAGTVSNIQDSMGIMLRSFVGIDEAGNIKAGSIFEKLKNAAFDFMTFLESVRPAIQSFVEGAVTQVAEFFGQLVVVLAPLGEWIKNNQELVITFLKGMAIGLGALLIIGTINALLNPLILTIAGVSLAAGLLYTAWQTNFWGLRDVTNVVITEVINFFNNYLMPAINAFVAYWQEIWPFVSLILQGAWNIIIGIVQVAWAVVYGIIKVGLAILSGDWGMAWEAIKQMVAVAWNGIKSIFNGIISFISGWGGILFNELTRPFRNAWNEISSLVNKIKDALDFTKRHSPSTLDIVKRGVHLVNDALTDLAVVPNIATPPQIAAGIGAVPGGAINSVSLNISLDGAIIADELGAQRMAEKLGDNIIRKLQKNVRF